MKSSAPQGSETRRGAHLILYDGVCGFCNRLTQFVLAHEADAIFDFASLQSETGRSLLRRFGRDPNRLDTLCVITNYRTDPAIVTKSDAALAVCDALRPPWRWLDVFHLVPVRVRDWVYDRIADHRYRIFGRYEACYVPSPEQRRRFIDV